MPPSGGTIKPMLVCDSAFDKVESNLDLFPHMQSSPPSSFVLGNDKVVRRLCTPGSNFSLWTVGLASPTRVDDWLGIHDAPPMATRTPVIAYGALCSPPVLAQKFELPVVLSKIRVGAASVVWGSRDDSADLSTIMVAQPGSVEYCFVLWCTPDQLDMVDAYYDVPHTYIRVPSVKLSTSISTLDGKLFDKASVCVPHRLHPVLGPDRLPMRCARVPYLRAQACAT